MKKTVLALALAMFIALGCSCKEIKVAKKINSTRLSAGFKRNIKIEKEQLSAKTAESLSDFSYSLFKNCQQENENAVISPLSAIYALAMAQNGAEGATLSEMESALGVSREDLNNYLAVYLSEANNKKSPLKISQSMWIREGAGVKNSFLQTNANYLAPDIYSSKMDAETISDINNWIDNKTDGEIKKAVEEISPETIALLINATLFDAKWLDEYKEYNIGKETFTNADNSKIETDFLYSTEYSYFSSDNLEGFLRYYESERFAFAAFLPNENISLPQLVSQLDGKSLVELIKNASSDKVEVAIPEFKIEYGCGLVEPLENMGISSAFSDKADFSALCDTPSYISDVFQKATIKLDRNGTKAAAVTVMGVCESAEIEEPNRVYLTRPFLYTIYDTEANLPIFIGTVTDLSK